MKVLYVIIAVLSVPATLVLSNLFWRALREARGVATLLSSLELLQSIVTADLLNSPPSEIARFAQPLQSGYGYNMRAFRHADEEAHSRGRSLLRPALAVVVIGSGVVGFLGVGWLGLALPIVNVLIVHTTFVGSTQGSIDSATTARAVEHVQIVAVILHRWYATSLREAAEWLESESRMKPLGELVTGLQTQ